MTMFLQIPGHENYQINESGVILDKNDDLVRTTTDKNCFMYVFIDNKIEYVHELVAKTFLVIHNENYIYPVHIDKDSLNNHISNICWSNKPEAGFIPKRENKYKCTVATYVYEIYNENTGDSIKCNGRTEVADIIQYEEISLKNMIGNNHTINLGPYKGYKIRRLGKIEG